MNTFTYPARQRFDSSLVEQAQTLVNQYAAGQFVDGTAQLQINDILASHNDQFYRVHYLSGNQQGAVLERLIPTAQGYRVYPQRLYQGFESDLFQLAAGWQRVGVAVMKEARPQTPWLPVAVIGAVVAGGVMLAIDFFGL